jgi:hypothetical protein
VVTKKADFNADEWATVVEAPVLAGMRVVQAGRGGTIRESLAIGRVYAEARQNQGDSELLDALVTSPPAVDPSRLQDGGDMTTVVGDRLREAVRLVQEKGSAEDAQAYREFIVRVGRTAAEAHKEGGFIGIGGKQIDDQEQAALDEIEAALGNGRG